MLYVISDFQSENGCGKMVLETTLHFRVREEGMGLFHGSTLAYLIKKSMMVVFITIILVNKLVINLNGNYKLRLCYCSFIDRVSFYSPSWPGKKL